MNTRQHEVLIWVLAQLLRWATLDRTFSCPGPWVQYYGLVFVQSRTLLLEVFIRHRDIHLVGSEGTRCQQIIMSECADVATQVRQFRIL